MEYDYGYVLAGFAGLTPSMIKSSMLCNLDVYVMFSVFACIQVERLPLMHPCASISF